VESFFQPPALIALDEYGLPLQLAQKLFPNLPGTAGLDGVLERLKSLEPTTLALTAFERALVAEAKRFA
jgi:hypothetical protein